MFQLQNLDNALAIENPGLLTLKLHEKNIFYYNDEHY